MGSVLILLVTTLGLIHPLRVEGIKNFHDGVVDDPFVDVPRKVKRRYPYGNSTAASINQYREEVRNGNDYNLVGENVGDATIFSDDVENISNAYVRHFTHAIMPQTQGEISLARFDMQVVKVGSKALFAGGATGDMSGQQSSVVDIYNSVGSTKVITKIPLPFMGGANEITLLDISGLQVPTSPANSGDTTKVLIVHGRGLVYNTRVHAIDTVTKVLTLKCPPRPNCGEDLINCPCTTLEANAGTQLVFRLYPDEPETESGSWDSTAALSVARQGMASCASDDLRIAIFAGGFSILLDEVEVTPHAAVDIFEYDSGFTSLTHRVRTFTPTANEPDGRPRYNLAATFHRGKAYFAGGVQGLAKFVTMDFSRRVDVYDPVADSWHLLPGPPVNQNAVDPEGMYTSRASFAMVSCEDEKLIIMAGGLTNGRFYRLAEATEYISQVDIYDTHNNVWLPITSFPSGIGRSDLGAAYHDGKVYFIGGATSTRFSDAVDIYVPAIGGGTWLTEGPGLIQRISQPRSCPLVTSIDFRPNIDFTPGGTVPEYEEMLLVIGGIVGGSTDRWFFEARSMASPRIDFIKDGEVLTVDFMHDHLSRGIMFGSAIGANGKLHVAGGMTNLHLASKRFEILTWTEPYICASIGRDNDFCAYKDMKRVRPGHFMLNKPTCDYQFLPPFKPWFCPCPNIESLEGTINFDRECTALRASDPTDDTACRTSPVCFTKCLLDQEAVYSSEHNGDVQAKYDCPGQWERPWDDVDEAYMLKTDMTIPYFGVHTFDAAGKRTTFGQVQNKYREIQECRRDCFPCGERVSLQGPCVKPNRFESNLAGA